MKNILITGVSTGIGFTTSKLFLEKGFRVFGSVRNKKDAERLQNEFGNNFTALIFDVTDTNAINAAAEQLKEILKGGYLHALVNNAGIAVFGPVLYTPLKEYQYQFDVNLYGVIRVIQAFSPFLMSRKTPGRIINISSISGLVSSPFLSPYCTSKFALESLSDSLRRELSIFGVKVVVIEPGPVETPIWKKARNDDRDFSETPYRDIFHLKDKMIKNSEKNAVPAIQVAKKIYQVCTSSNPRLRYIVSKNNFRIWLFSKIVPGWLIDQLYLRAFKKQNFRP